MKRLIPIIVSAIIGCGVHNYTYKDPNTNVKYSYGEDKTSLKLNHSNILKWYSGKSLEERKKELVELARKEKEEEMFVHTLPDNKWYEVGCVSDNLSVDAILPFFLRKSPISKVKEMYLYHTHPLHTVLQIAEQRLDKKDSYKALRFAPPNIDDFKNSILLEKYIKENIVHREFAVDAFGIWEYAFLRDLKKAEHNSFKKAFIETEVLWRSDYDISATEFIEAFNEIFEKRGFNKKDIILNYERIYTKPSKAMEKMLDEFFLDNYHGKNSPQSF